MSANFGTLYTEDVNTGVVIPNVSGVKSSVTNAFKDIFGPDISTDESTPTGRIIEAITLMFVDVLRVTAQNANAFNPYQAVGYQLDSIGALFGVPRLTDQTDDSYRKSILDSRSRGSGFVESVRNEISSKSGVTHVCVLENGKADPANLPNGTYGVQVPAHSMFVAVLGGSDNDVANAIYNTRSAGCGFKTATVGGVTPTTVQKIDETTGSTTDIVFYRPSQMSIGVTVAVNTVNYTGTDSESVIKNAVLKYLNANHICAQITAAEISAAIAQAGAGLFCTSAAITYGGQNLQQLSISPYQYIAPTSSDITVL